MPFTLVKTWQFAKHSRAALRVITADDFAHRLVVGQNADRHGLDTHGNRAAIDFDAVTKLNALTHMGQFIIDSDASFANQSFHLEARTQPRLGQDFVQLGGIVAHVAVSPEAGSSKAMGIWAGSTSSMDAELKNSLTAPGASKGGNWSSEATPKSSKNCLVVA